MSVLSNKYGRDACIGHLCMLCRVVYNLINGKLSECGLSIVCITVKGTRSDTL
jgi:hypothetical protein